MSDKPCVALGVTGGIAAYKACMLTSMLASAGYDVRVVMTDHAQEFVAPLTFETLSKNRVITDTFDRAVPWEVDHVALAKAADIVVVAPATANIIAKAANGIADDFLSTFLLAANCKKIFAPAMNTAMLNSAPNKRNMETIKADGAELIFGASGMLACGDLGSGRMAEPAEIFAAIEAALTEKKLQGIKLMVTAGATKEPIDDVRYITNRSSGKMGVAIAKRAAEMGAEVTLVCGEAVEKLQNVRQIYVKTAADMAEAVFAEFDNVDAVIKAAAVADYTPEEKVEGKIKKGGDMSLALKRTEDILAALGAKKKHQKLIGFAAEAADVMENARGKLNRKGLDAIVVNDISRSDIGFGSDNNCGCMIFADGREKELPIMSKRDFAENVLLELAEMLK